MKTTLFILSSLALVGTAAAQDAQTVLRAAQDAMGITGMKSMHFTASGYLADTGEAASGNAPRPFVKDYEADIDFATPCMRLRIHRTNPDGTALTYGSEELQFFSGTYAWDQYPGEKRVGPTGVYDSGGRVFARTLAQVIAGRRMQILLTPPGFVLAALASDAFITTAGTSSQITFSSAEGQRYVGTFNRANLLTKIVTTDPLTRQRLEVSFSQYKTFMGVRLPARVVQTENHVTLADLTISDVKPNVGTALAVPPDVPQAAQVERPGG